MADEIIGAMLIEYTYAGFPSNRTRRCYSRKRVWQQADGSVRIGGYGSHESPAAAVAYIRERCEARRSFRDITVRYVKGWQDDDDGPEW